ncbi:MAG: DUF2905 domain-containing protein [Bryobacteraceae bacterium]|jgi:hypothetical protein
MGRWLIGAGVFLVVAGLVVIIGERVGIRIGRLPGDIRVEGKHGVFYFPVVSCILIGVILSVVSWLFRSR